MSAPRIRADYEQLETIQKELTQNATQTGQWLQSLKSCVGTLQQGDWVGQGATQFYAEMNDSVFPTVSRLQQALQRAGEATGQMARLIKEAEDAAAALFKLDGATGGAPSGGGAPVAAMTPPSPLKAGQGGGDPPPPPVEGTPYEVKQGDTLWGIAAQNGISVEQLMAFNNLTSETIYPGQDLSIPPQSYEVPGDYAPPVGGGSGGGSGGGTGADDGTLAAQETVPGGMTALDPDQVTFFQGFSGQTNNGSDSHNGIDINGPVGEDVPIYASYKGEILFYWDGDFATNSDNSVNNDATQNYGWGNSMVVEYKYDDQTPEVQAQWQEQYPDIGSGQSLFIEYAHLETGFEDSLPEDYRVNPGDQLALMGNSGNSDAKHLHIGVKVGDSGSVTYDEGSGTDPNGDTVPTWYLSGDWWNMDYVDPEGLEIVPGS